MTLKTGVKAAENSAVITGINDILKYIQIENKFIKIVMSFHNITVFIVFAIK